MLRQSPPIDPELHQSSSQLTSELIMEEDLDIQVQLDRLEETILESPRIPLTRKTLIDEEQLLDLVDSIRMSLPDTLVKAEQIIRQRKEILAEAENEAEEMIQAASRRAAQMLNEMPIRQQAELEATQIRQKVERECLELQQKTLAQIEQMRSQAEREIEEFRQTTIAECQNVQNGADEYADLVLSQLEQQLKDMLKIIGNGRAQLNNEELSHKQPTTNNK
jgi:vacuolar-type H+-ATPase subunit H